MVRTNNTFSILYFSVGATAILILIKLAFHYMQLEVLQLGALHTSVIAGSFFVISFILSASISDYKEAEKLPSEFSSTIENMYFDAVSIKRNYPKFKLEAFRKKLLEITVAFKQNVRIEDTETHHRLQELNVLLADLEKAGVPPNFIAKLKQEQSQLIKSLYRIDYIKKIQFIPSAFILAQLVAFLAVGLLIITAVEPFYAGLALTAIISFLLIYILRLIKIISTPFHASGKTRDDVSLFIVSRTIAHLEHTHHKNI